MTRPNGSWSLLWELGVEPATQEGIRLRGGTGVLGALRQVGYLQNVSEEH